MTDFLARRTMMVDTQVRPSDVTKFPIIESMLTVPRENFVPNQMIEAAYLGENLDIGAGRVMLEPRSLAKLLEALDLQPTETVLDIGCGYGYSAAVIARMVDAVIAIEDDEGHARDAQHRLSAGGVDNAAVMAAPLAEGAAKHGPYDAIIIQGGVEVVPQALLDQLRVGGRIGCIFMEGRLGIARIGHRTADGVTWRFAFNAAAPVLAGFEKRAAFAL